MYLKETELPVKPSRETRLLVPHSLMRSTVSDLANRVCSKLHTFLCELRSFLTRTIFTESIPAVRWMQRSVAPSV